MLIELLLPAVIGLLVIFGIGLILARLYNRSTRDMAYGHRPRRPEGGARRRPAGAADLPLDRAVNLKTLRLEVRRGEGEALITKDRMRVDIGAEFRA